VSEWKDCKLGDVIVTNAKTIDKSYPFESILYLDTGSITEGKIESFQKIDVKDAPSRAKRLVKANDIVYSTVRPIQRHYGILKNPQPNLVVSTGFTVIEVNQNLAHPDFIYYLLSADESVEFLDVIAEASTSTYPSLKPSDIENLDISLPELEEQKAIASVLRSLDDKIGLLHSQNTTLEAMAETLFRLWFVEEAEEGWKVVSLGDLFEISSGKGLKKEQLSDTGLYPVLGANGEIGRTNDFLFNEKLIFTGRVGTLGNFFRVNNEKVWLSDNTLIFRNIKYFYFVYFTLQKASLSDYNVGSTQPLIRQSDIKCIEILIPKKQEKLYQFETESELIFTKINSNNKQIQTLEKLRDNLLPKLMSGDIRIEA
jgi:type I restriction enzyme S subunit